MGLWKCPGRLPCPYSHHSFTNTNELIQIHSHIERNLPIFDDVTVIFNLFSSLFTLPPLQSTRMLYAVNVDILGLNAQWARFLVSIQFNEFWFDSMIFEKSEKAYHTQPLWERMVCLL